MVKIYGGNNTDLIAKLFFQLFCNYFIGNLTGFIYVDGFAAGFMSCGNRSTYFGAEASVVSAAVSSANTFMEGAIAMIAAVKSIAARLPVLFNFFIQISFGFHNSLAVYKNYFEGPK